MHPLLPHRPLFLVALALLAGGCRVGADYVRPTVDTPAAFKEWQGWKSAEPQDEVPRDRWWEAYGDKDLDALIEQVNVSNQNIKQAEAQYRAARALAASARAAYFPVLALDATATRATAGTSVLTGTGTGVGGSGSVEPSPPRRVAPRASA